MADRKGGLGRGIGALIPTSDSPNERPIDVFFGGPAEASDLVPVPGARFGHVDVAAIVPNPKQPRKEFEAEAFAELVNSIRNNGILQPIVVRPLGEQDGQPRYELIMGERRLRASKEVGLAKIPAVIRETEDNKMLSDALLENLHRSNLNPLEEASAYQQLLEDFGITQEELADRLGSSRPKITNTIRLLRLPEQVQVKVAAGVLSAGHARAILGLKSDEEMIDMAKKVIDQGLSVRSVEELIALGTKPDKGGLKVGGRQDAMKALAEQIGDQLSTTVKIQLGSKKGVMSIEFASIADLNRILDELGIQRNEH